MKKSALGKRVAIVVIGNEVLSAEVSENNATYLSRELTRLGSRVERILVLPDEEAVISREVRRLSREFDAILVTGGIGVTHDDVTRQAMAAAFKLPLQVHREALAVVRSHYGRELNRWRRKLAELPIPSRLLTNPAGSAPGFVTGKVYVFPGVPRMLRAMFPLIRSEFTGPAVVTRVIRTAHPESVFAGPLGRIARANPDVGIGSYPIVSGRRHLVKLVLRSRDPKKLQTAGRRVERLLAKLEAPGSRGRPKKGGPALPRGSAPRRKRH